MRIDLMRACAAGLRRNTTSHMCGHRHVADKLSAAADIALVLLPRQPRPNALIGHASSSPHGSRWQHANERHLYRKARSLGKRGGTVRRRSLRWAGEQPYFAGVDGLHVIRDPIQLSLGLLLLAGET